MFKFDSHWNGKKTAEIPRIHFFLSQNISDIIFHLKSKEL